MWAVVNLGISGMCGQNLNTRTGWQDVLAWTDRDTKIWQWQQVSPRFPTLPTLITDPLIILTKLNYLCCPIFTHSYMTKLSSFHISRSLFKFPTPPTQSPFWYGGASQNSEQSTEFSYLIFALKFRKKYMENTENTQKKTNLSRLCVFVGRSAC